ncbi:MAG: DUF58 domain-containing protein [Lachnospiraceae bacterium]|nr:DUF58 domain-containing protein [Lachnospiraceae bacterium]
MNPSWIVVILLWILSLVGISFYGGPVSYGFFAAITLVPVVSFIYILIVLFRFKIYQEANRIKVVANSITKFYITLQNEDFFTYSGIRIQFYSPFSTILGIDENTEYELMPFSGIKKETSLLCRYRGEYEVGIKSIVVRDYLKLFKLTYQNHEPFRINVMPEILHLSELKTINAADTSSVETMYKADQSDVTVREYIPGDDIRKIHWKATASSGKLLVRNVTGEEKQGIAIMMDSQRYSDDPSVYLPLENQICRIVLSLCAYFNDNRTPVRVLSYTGALDDHVMKDTDGFNSFYSYLSSFAFDEKYDLSDMLKLIMNNLPLYTGHQVIMVIHKVNAAVLSSTDRLKLNGINPIIYLVTDDNEEADSATALLNSNLYVISTEADLKEVL